MNMEVERGPGETTVLCDSFYVNFGECNVFLTRASGRFGLCTIGSRRLRVLALARQAETARRGCGLSGMVEVLELVIHLKLPGRHSRYLFAVEVPHRGSVVDAVDCCTRGGRNHGKAEMRKLMVERLVDSSQLAPRPGTLANNLTSEPRASVQTQEYTP